MVSLDHACVHFHVASSLIDSVITYANSPVSKRRRKNSFANNVSITLVFCLLFFPFFSPTMLLPLSIPFSIRSSGYPQAVRLSASPFALFTDIIDKKYQRGVGFSNFYYLIFCAFGRYYEEALIEWKRVVNVHSFTALFCCCYKRLFFFVFWL